MRTPAARRGACGPRPGHQQRGTATLWTPAALPGAAPGPVCGGQPPRAPEPGRGPRHPAGTRLGAEPREPAGAGPGGGAGRGAPALITCVSNRQQPMGRESGGACARRSREWKRLRSGAGSGRGRLPKWVHLVQGTPGGGGADEEQENSREL